MSFDARSKERLEALGRTLPTKLPLPDSKIPTGVPQPSGREGKQGEAPRHTLEREQDPAELFRVLMQTSPDGTVPPHLLERLRELETLPLAPPAKGMGNRSERLSKDSPTQGSKTPGAQAPRAKTQARRPSRSGRATGVGKEEQDLYSSFAQLLLEDDDA
jgi:hypothetical protein